MCDSGAYMLSYLAQPRLNYLAKYLHIVLLLIFSFLGNCYQVHTFCLVVCSPVYFTKILKETVVDTMWVQ